MKLSIISPVYMAENIVDELVDKLVLEVEKIVDDFEIILVEDGSPDDSWEKVLNNCKKDNRVKGIKLSRNFGQHYAITAGIEHASGDINVILDCDLQDSPENIQLLIDSYKEGNEVVFTKRISRKHSFFKSINAKIFNFVFRFVSHKDFDVNAGTMILFGKKAREAFLSVNDHERLYLQLFKWVGFQKSMIPVKHSKRHSGKSSYNFFGLLKIAIQGFTSFSNKLLSLSIILGLTFSIIAFTSIVVIAVLYFVQGFMNGWASLISSIFLCTGIILFNLGILGLYIGKTFNQSKNRPLYVIDQQENLE